MTTYSQETSARRQHQRSQATQSSPTRGALGRMLWGFVLGLLTAGHSGHSDDVSWVSIIPSHDPPAKDAISKDPLQYSPQTSVRSHPQTLF